MGTVLAAAAALMLTATGATATITAPLGAAGYGGQYLAGHVLLGLGLGYSVAILVRVAFKRLAARLAISKTGVASPPTPTAVVTVLPVRPAAMLPLRGRHAA